MRALGDWLLGLFTRHLATKILSLILAVVLLGFVQKNLSGDRQLRAVVLNFRLGSDIEATHVLLTPRVQLRGLRITGLRSRVDAVAQRFTLANEVAIILDREFLRATAGYQEGQRVVLRIDREFFRIHPAVLGEGVDLSTEVESPPTVEVDTSESRLFEVVADPATPSERLVPAADGPFTPPAGARAVAIRFDPPQVLLRGPRSYLPQAKPDGPPSPLYVEVPDLSKRSDLREGENSIPVDRIDWTMSGVNAEGLAFLQLGRPGRSTAETLGVRALFSLEARNVVEEIPELPFQMRGFDLLAETPSILERYEIRASGLANFETADLAKGICRRVKVEMSRTLQARRNELRERLVLVVDLENRRQTEGDFDAPVYLDVRDARDPEARRILQAVRLAGKAELNFTRKPPP